MTPCVLQRGLPGSVSGARLQRRSCGGSRGATPRWRASRPAAPTALLWFGGGASKAKAKQKQLVGELLELVDGTERGLACDKARTAEIAAAVDALAELGGEQVTTGSSLSATWKLLWTTEKETLFIVEKAGLFGTEAGEVYQVIDVEGGTLQNVITFPPDGAFIVTSGVSVAGPQRMDFKFSAAKLKLPKRDIPFPPVGQGWFESVYLDDEIRVARDVRGDTLVVARDGPPRLFE
eukprot:jgi/Tetstr1/457082/TSEL_043743.t1